MTIPGGRRTLLIEIRKASDQIRRQYSVRNHFLRVI